MAFMTKGMPVGARECFPVNVTAFGRLDIYLHGARLRFPGKTPHKPLNLMRGLLVAGGRGVSRRALCDALWPDLDSGMSRQALNAAVFRLRRLLRDKDALSVDGEHLVLSGEHCRVDAWEFENGLAVAADPGQLEAVLSRYQGPFLGDSEHPLVFETRERLRRKFVRGVNQLGQTFERQDAFERALEVYEHALDVESGNEELHRMLIGCLGRAGRTAEAKAAYQRCRAAMDWYNGALPTAATEHVYRGLADSLTA